MQVDDLFARAAYAQDEAGWISVHSLGGMCMSHLSTPQGVPLLRANYELPMSFEEALVRARPEVFMHPRRAEYDALIEECGVEEVFAPGDAVIWIRPRLSPTVRRLASLAGAFAHLSRAGDNRQNLLFVKTRLRMVMRRDVPRLGQFTVVAAPLDPDTGELLEDGDTIVGATVGVVEPHADGAQIRVSQLQLRTWKASHLMPLALGRHHGIFQVFICNHENLVFQQAVVWPGRYTVVSIRRYHRGAPILPRRGAASLSIVPGDWDSVDSHSFALTEYLREFCSRVGLELEFWSSLDGRQLVRYQTAVLTVAWERVWSLLEPVFKAQRGAYRRLLGGSDAPGLMLQEPRFLDDSREANRSPAKMLQGMSELNTFVHYHQRTLAVLYPHMRRSGSEPNLDSLAGGPC